MTERLLPFAAHWGVGFLAVLLVLALGGVVWLGRGRRWLVPERWSGRAVSALLLVVVALAGLGLAVALGPLAPILAEIRRIDAGIGREVAELRFREVADDSEHRLSELRGKVVLVNLWATWCPPCREELPHLDRLQTAYRDQGLVVVTVSDEDRAVLEKFAAQQPLTTLNAYTSELGWFDVPGRPLSVVVDRQGTVRKCIIGSRDYAEFERAVVPHLGV